MSGEGGVDGPRAQTRQAERLQRTPARRHDGFPVKVGDLSMLPTIRYVITLDSDTQLPLDTARELIATMAHPLNHPVIDPATEYRAPRLRLLQPRVSISMESARARAWPAFTAARPASILTPRRLRRLSGSLRRRPASRARASTMCARSTRWRASAFRKHAPQPRSHRRRTRPRRPGHRPGSDRRLSFHLRKLLASASIAGCAATGRSLPGSSAAPEIR